LPADSITQAITNVYSSWVGIGQFNTHLDFAIRDWARRSGTVRRALDLSDDARIEAPFAMFKRFEFSTGEAEIRARVLYFTQIGYDALDQRESWEVRANHARDWQSDYSSGGAPWQAAFLPSHARSAPSVFNAERVKNDRKPRAAPLMRRAVRATDFA